MDLHPCTHRTVDWVGETTGPRSQESRTAVIRMWAYSGPSRPMLRSAAARIPLRLVCYPSTHPEDRHTGPSKPQCRRTFRMLLQLSSLGMQHAAVWHAPRTFTPRCPRQEDRMALSLPLPSPFRTVSDALSVLRFLFSFSTVTY